MSDAVVTFVDEAPRGDIPDDRGVQISLVSEATGAKNVAFHINVLRPGKTGPYHYHERSENCYVVLSGEGEIVLDGVPHRVGAESVVFIPPGVPHSVASIGPAPLKLLEIYAPPLDDDFNILEE